MNIDPNTDPPPRERASQLVNDYARLAATLEAATSQIRAEITALTAALNKAAAPHVHELELIEAEAKQLALDHGAEIFGEGKCSLTENGMCLATRCTDVVQIEDEDAALQALMRESVKGATDAERIAASACVRLNPQINKQYILSQYDSAPEWFALWGITLVERVSASLKPAPKPRAKKASKLKTEGEP
jgi:hypothetical protein